MKMRSYTTILIGFVFLFSAISGANLAAAQTDVKNEGIYIYETFGEPDILDPSSNYETAGSGMNELTYETLIDYKGNSAVDLEGKLATSWDVSADGLKYTFNLRKGVKHHDGVEFNAYVMKYSIDRVVIMNDYSGPGWMLALYIAGGADVFNSDDANVTTAKAYLAAGGVNVLEDYKLEINLDTPYVPFIYALAYRVGAAISPKAVIDNKPSDYTTNQSDDEFGMVSLADWFPDLAGDYTKLGLAAGHADANSGVVPQSDALSDAAHEWLKENEAGTGPYKLSVYDAGNQYTFVKSGDWWGKYAQNAVDTFIYKTVTEGTTRILDLKAGDADHSTIDATLTSEIIDKAGVNGVPPADAQLTDDNLQLFTGPTFNVGQFSINFNSSLPADKLIEAAGSTYDASTCNKYSWGTEKASPDNPFTCLEFRKAAALSFDRDAYINVVANGYSMPLEGVIPSGMFGHDDQLVEDGLIPTYNKDAAKAIFESVGWKGEFSLWYNAGNEGRKQLALMLKDAIESMAIGITIDVQEQTWPTYLASYRGGELPIFYIGWAPDYADPDNYVVPYFADYGAYSGRTKYLNPGLSDKITAAAAELDSATREAAYSVIEREGAADYVFIYGTQSVTFSAVRTWIYDYEESGSLNPMSSLENIEKINKGSPASTAPGFEFSLTLLTIGMAVLFVLRRRKN